MQRNCPEKALTLFIVLGIKFYTLEMFDSCSISTDDVEGCKKTMPHHNSEKKTNKQAIYKIVTLLRLLGELRSQGNQMNEIPKTDKPLHRDTNQSCLWRHAGGKRWLAHNRKQLKC